MAAYFIAQYVVNDPKLYAEYQAAAAKTIGASGGEVIAFDIAAETIEFGEKEMRVTASFGGACLERATSAEDGEALIRVADSYLYKAKENGRNRCEVHSLTELPGR